MKWIVITLFFSLLVPNLAWAEIEAGITPDSPFYFLDTFSEKISSVFIFDAEKKTQKFLQLAEERIAEAKEVSIKNKNKAAEKAIDLYDKSIVNALDNAKKIEKEEISQSALNIISEETEKHKNVLVIVLEKVPEETKYAIQKAIDKSSQYHNEAVQEVEKLKAEISQLKQEINELKEQIKENEVVEFREENLSQNLKEIRKQLEKKLEEENKQTTIPSSKKSDAAIPVTPAILTIPAKLASPSQPYVSPTLTSTPTVSVSPSPTASPSYSPTPTSTPTQSPTPDTLGPWITSISISPTNGYERERITFSVTAEDSAGIGNIVYDIRYPNDGRYDVSYYLRPNCNFYGAKSWTCIFSESVDHATQPQLYGQYVIESVRAADMLGNISTYYPNGTVSNGLQSNHNLVIPVITITVAPITPIVTDNFNNYASGSIVGQGGWESYANGSNWIVQGITTFEGTGALRNNTPADSLVGKKGTLLLNGKQAVYIKTNNRSGWHTDSGYGLRISKGLNGYPFVAVDFKKDGAVRYYDLNSGIYKNFAVYNDNQWTLLEVEWRSSDTRVRYRVNNGAWTNWYTFWISDYPFGNIGPFAGFDYVNSNFYLPSGSGEVYVDNLH